VGKVIQTDAIVVGYFFPGQTKVVRLENLLKERHDSSFSEIHAFHTKRVWPSPWDVLYPLPQ
jgi:hypothetical protein